MKFAQQALCVMVVLLIALPARGQAPALPAAVQASVPTPLNQVGAGQMRWLGLKIYEASLWLPTGQKWSADSRFALALRYARDIAGERLVDTSIDEIRRLKLADETRLPAWRSALEKTLPSVAEGDVLVGLRQPEGGARFWHNGKLTAEITDADLARAFFAIWLDPRTREPALRQSLLGKASP